MRRVLRFLTLAFPLLAVTTVSAQIDARMLRYPAVSADRIAFVYAGDIWIAPKEGGMAQRLSTPRGEEMFPRFSPDGSLLAFTGNYDGNQDLYVMPVLGGVPARVTHHPAPDRMLGWFPDGGSLLYSSVMASGKPRFNQLWQVPKGGGLPSKLPVPYGEFGAVSPDGKTLAYMPLSRDFRTWKRYRGGMAPDIWLFDLQDRTSRNLTSSDANDSQPMWHGRKLYFLSDRDANKRYNIWSWDPDGGAFRQITFFEEYDVRFPSIGPSDIVFEAGGRLHLLDLATGKYDEVRIQVVTDQATLRPRAEKVASLVRSADISPSGKRAVFEARGDVFSLPAEHGPILNLSRTSGVAERYPSWSPDGKWLAYFSDRTGEYELTLRPTEGSGEERTVTSLGAGFRYTPQWSPDSKKIVFIDQLQAVHLVDVDAGRVQVVDEGLWLSHGGLQNFRVSWSADSRWFSYVMDAGNRRGAVYVHDTRNSMKHAVTGDFYNELEVAFDPDGKYLYVLTDRNFEPSYSNLDGTWIYANTTQVAAIPLRKDVPSPVAPRSDEEKPAEKPSEDASKEKAAKEAKGGKAKDDEADSKPEEKAPKPVEIDFDGIESRLVVLPPKAGRYANLKAVAGKVVYRRLARTGSGEDKSPLVYYDLEAREEKTVLDNANGFALSADGKKLLVRRGQDFFIVDLKADAKADKQLATAELEVTVDPVAEWRQLYQDAWRFQRDYFYDPGMHGVDWNEMHRRYGALLEWAVTRWDVDFVIGELIAELNASHAYRGGGDVETPAQRQVGLLGVDWSLENGAYRIARILDGAVWDNEVRSPLRQPGVDVKEGDYILAVNGVPLDTTKDPWASFQGLAGKTVQLTVNDKPTLDGARHVLVETLATLTSEIRLRNLAWIEENRRKVEAASGGRIGYIYVPSTGFDGQKELVRMFQGQFTKEGLIVDERFNDGGQIPDRFIELLNRPITSYWGVRSGKDWQWPPIAHHGPKAMLINAWSGSGGDAFPYYFRLAGLGPLIGTRTWGGLIGISGAPQLVDGGTVTVPTFGMYGLDGEWAVEGYGVDPDIEVVDDPALMQDGGDPQLERAIREVMSALERNPPRHPAKPAYPDRSGR
jgi:tricorn protease